MLEKLQNLMHLLRAGGITMVPLYGCSVVGLAVIIERFVVLRPKQLLDQGLMTMIEGLGENSSLESLRNYCRQQPRLMARIVRRVLELGEIDREQCYREAESIGREESSVLERHLHTLEVIAQISPLLGLLGTVVGMVDIFTELSRQGQFGGFTGQVLSSGISKALITTVAGLVIAIPALISHAYFTRVVDRCVGEMEKYTHLLLTRLYAKKIS